MFLYLVRHAAAGDRDEVRWPDDTLRPLTRSGAARFHRAARGIGALVPQVDIVLASPSLRAWDTAMILHEEAKWPAPVPSEVLRNSPADQVLTFLRELDSHGSVALVGHEPYLSVLASVILSPPNAGVALEMKKGAIAAIQVSDLQALAAPMLLWLLPPRVLRRLGK
jgi:phosphohistidine phosphatase